LLVGHQMIALPNVVRYRVGNRIVEASIERAKSSTVISACRGGSVRLYRALNASRLEFLVDAVCTPSSTKMSQESPQLVSLLLDLISEGAQRL
jgi:hypothetical protein